MFGTEGKVFEIISKRKKVSFFEIAKLLGISTDYTRLICRGLERNGHISISGNYCSTPTPPRRKPSITKKPSVPKLKPPSLSLLKSINKRVAKTLKRKGYSSVKDIAEAPFVKFMQSTGLSLAEAAKIFNEARKN